MQRVLFVLYVSIALAACDDGKKASFDAGADAGTDTDTGESYDPRFQPLVDAVEDELQNLGAPGVAIAIVEGGEVTFAKGFGSKHPYEDDPVRATTLFRLASVNKMLTAVGLLQLVDDGSVALGDPITDHLPDFDFAMDATWASSITVEHLLTHSSGIVDHLEVDADESLKDDDALAEYMNGGFGQVAYLMAPAGRMYNYSNPNFILAGLVTETVSGEYYREYLDVHVFTPLGMDRTFFLPPEVITDGDFAFGDGTHWETGLPTIVEPDSYDNGWGRPAGYAWSSVLDTARFLIFLAQGNQGVLSDVMRTEMQSPRRLTQELVDIAYYGYGLLVSEGFFLGSGADFYDMRLVSHNGALSGYSADFYYIPDMEFGLITLANGEGAYFSNSFVVAVNTLCDLPQKATPPNLSVSSTTYDSFTGEFMDSYNVGQIFVTREGDHLMIDMPLLDSLDIPYDTELYPASPDNFILEIQGYSMLATFLFDAADDVEYFRTRSFVGHAVSSSAQKALELPIVPSHGPQALLDRLARQLPVTAPSI